MYSRFRTICSVYNRSKVFNQSYQITKYFNTNYKQNTKTINYTKIIPVSICLSLFTWLGFGDEKEDELILTIKRSVLLIQRQEYNKAEQMLHVALRMAQTRENEQGITYIYDVMANLALENEQYDKAKKLFIAVSQRLLTAGVSQDDIRLVHISLKLARISHLQKDYQVAQTGFDWCLEKLKSEQRINPNADVEKLIAILLDWYGKLLIECNRTEIGLQYLQDSYNMIMKMEGVDDQFLAMQLNDIGTVCENCKKYDESEYYIKLAIEKGKNIQDFPMYGALYVNLGRVYMRKQLFDEARKACGFGYRLAYDRNMDVIKNEALQCIKELKNLASG